MLKNTFCHVPGIGLVKEKRIWDSGIHSWEDLRTTDGYGSLGHRTKHLAQLIDRSFEELEKNNPQFFAELLPSNQQWRMFPSFRSSLAYLDIETTGLGFGESITTIALYDGRSLFHYVNGHNLDDFKSRIREYDVLVTYNGKCFDVPFIEQYFAVELNHAHIDLRHLLGSLGYSGGLKGCEQIELNCEACHIEDVLNLEKLLTIAYNMKLMDTPFCRSHLLESPPDRVNPFRADARTVRRITARLGEIY